MPHWSGNAGKIAFVSNRHNNVAVQIYVMDPDGTGVVRLTDNQHEDLNGHRCRWHQRGGPDQRPDGSRLVFSSNLQDPRTGHFELYVMDSIDSDGDGVGDNLTRITNSAPTVHNSAPIWSPDELYTVAPDGSGLVQFTSDPTSNHTGARFLP